MRKFITSAVFAAALGAAGAAQAQEDINITLVPGLTTDAFYITMNRGAQAAAEALGITVGFQGAEEFDPVLQTPVLDAVIARGPDAIHKCQQAFPGYHISNARNGLLLLSKGRMTGLTDGSRVMLGYSFP